MTSLDKYISLASPSAKGSVKEAVTTALLMYLFAAINFNEFRAYFQKETGDDFDRHVRTKMVCDTDVMYQVKFPLYAAVGKADTVVGLRQEARKRGLLVKDATLVDHLTEEDLSDYLLGLRPKYKALSIEKFRHEIGQAWLRNKTNTFNFAWYKMRFLCNWGLDLSDIVDDCAERTLRALMLQYPLIENRTHFNNLYKQTFRQAGLKLIKHYTAKRRSVFDESGNLRRFSVDYDLPDNPGSAVDLVGTSGLTGHDDSASDDVLTVRSVLERGNLSNQEQSLMLYLMGETDDDFEAWLSSQYHVPLKDKDAKEYLSACCAYLHIPRSRLAELQTMLSQGVMTAPPPRKIEVPLGWG